MDAMKGRARFSVRLTSTIEIQNLSKLLLHSERQLLVLRFDTNHHNKQLEAGYGSHTFSQTKLLPVCCKRPEPTTPDQSMFDLVKEIVDVHRPVQRHGIQRVFTF